MSNPTPPLPLPASGSKKKYRRKKRGQNPSRKKKKVITPRWEANYRHPASRFLIPEHKDTLRTINKPVGDDPEPKKIPMGRGLSHSEAVQIMLASMRQRVAEYETKPTQPKLLPQQTEETTPPTPTPSQTAPHHKPARRRSSAYADALGTHKAIAELAQVKHDKEKNKIHDIGAEDPLYTSGLTWGEITERRQRERKYHEVFPSFKPKTSLNAGLSEAYPLRGCVSVLERPDYQWTIEGQKEGRRTRLKHKTQLPLLLSKTLHLLHTTAPNTGTTVDTNDQEKLDLIMTQNVLNVARTSIALVSTWARYRATYRILLPTFTEHFSKPSSKDSTFHVTDIVMVHQKATDMWLSASVITIDGFDPDVDPEEQELHAHHERHHSDNAKEHAADAEGEDEHKRLRTMDIDSDSDEEGRGHGQQRTVHEEEEVEYQRRLLVRFKNRSRAVDQDMWIACHIGRLRRQYPLNPNLCNNLHHDVPTLRPRKVGGLPRAGDKVVVAVVDFHCAELYTKLGLLPVGVCIGQRHVTDQCKIEIQHAVLNKKWVGWYNNRHVQVVTTNWFEAIATEWERCGEFAKDYKTAFMLEQEAEEKENGEEEGEVYRM